MKKILALFLAILLCISCSLSVYAESAQPRWKVLTTMSVGLVSYNGLYNNAELLTDAACGHHNVRIEMTTVITRWNGSKYEDTDKTWSDSGNGVAEVHKTFRLSEGNYVARTTVTLYDANGAFIETVTAYSDELII